MGGFTLLVDERIGSRDLLPALVRLGLPAVKSRFEGDIAFEGRGEKGKKLLIGIEFKKVGELVQAIRTGRLQGHQLKKMRDTYDFSWLLIEGELKFDKKSGALLRRAGRREFRPMGGGMGISELLKRLIVLQIAGGLTPWFTQNREQSIQVISALYRTWSDKDLDQHKSHIAIYKPPALLPISDFRYIISGLPGIGLENSRTAEEYFGSLEIAFAASESDWAEVDGVGKVTAKKIRDMIRKVEKR